MGIDELFPPINQKWLANARRRYSSAYVGGEFDRVPIDPMMLAHSTVACGYTIRDFYERPELGVHCLAYIQELYDLLPVTKYFFAHPWLMELGIELRFMDLTAPVPVAPVISEPEEAEGLETPSLEEVKGGETFKRLTGAMDYIKEKIPGMFVPLAYCPEPVGGAAELCGVENFIMWTFTDRDLAKRLVRIYTDTAIHGAEGLAKRYGMAMLTTGAVLANNDIFDTDTISDLAPDNLNYMVNECFKRGAGPQVFYHFCGNHQDDYRVFVDRIVYSPFTVVQIGYSGRDPFPAQVLKDTFGNKATIEPSVDTKLFVLPEPMNVYEQARGQILAGRDSPKGFILGTACEVPPLLFPGNLLAMRRAAEDFGTYGQW